MSRTSEPRVVPYNDRKGDNLFCIKVTICARLSQKGESKQTGGYPSEAEALADVPHFVKALNSIGRGQKLQWKSFKERSMSETVAMRKSIVLSLPSASCNVLNALENRQLSMIRKDRLALRDVEKNVIISRVDFKNVFVGGRFMTARTRRAKAKLRLKYARRARGKAKVLICAEE